MTPTQRWGGGLAFAFACACASLLVTPDAHGEQVKEGELAVHKVGVSYSAPAGCPSVGEFMTSLASFLAGTDPLPLYTRVELSELQSGYRLRLTVYVGALPLQREEVSASCRELARLAALMTAVARTEPRPRPAAITVDRVPEPVFDVEPLAADATHAPDSVTQSLEPSARRADLEGSHLLLGAQVQSAMGLLPGVAFGMGVAFEAAWPSFALRLLGSSWLPHEAAAPAGLESLPALTLGLQALDLGVCLKQALYDEAPIELHLKGCAVLSGYRITSETHQVGRGTSVSYRGAGGFSAGASLGLWSALDLSLQVGLSNLLRPFEVVEPPYVDALYRSESSLARLEVTLGYRFGGSGGG